MRETSSTNASSFKLDCNSWERSALFRWAPSLSTIAVNNLTRSGVKWSRFNEPTVITPRVFSAPLLIGIEALDFSP